MTTIDRVWAYILGYIAANGYPPTRLEISDAVGLSGKSHASYYLSKLKGQGKLTWKPSSPRSIKILE